MRQTLATCLAALWYGFGVFQSFWTACVALILGRISGRVYGGYFVVVRMCMEFNNRNNFMCCSVVTLAVAQRPRTSCKRYNYTWHCSHGHGGETVSIRDFLAGGAAAGDCRGPTTPPSRRTLHLLISPTDAARLVIPDGLVGLVWCSGRWEVFRAVGVEDALWAWTPVVRSARMRTLKCSTCSGLTVASASGTGATQ